MAVGLLGEIVWHKKGEVILCEDKKVYIVHCIDTEGPLYESLLETFIRIENMTGFKLEPTMENLKKIQNKELDLKGHEDIASKIFSKRFLDYKDTWNKIDEMLDVMTSSEYREKFSDSFHNGWKYNWFIMDWVNFEINPRRRDLGYHNIYDHYQEYYAINHLNDKIDEFHWHAHPMSTYKEAHKCATSFLNSPHIFESLTRRLLDKAYFPTCFRAGFDTERPDSHWLLEQYIPFDFSNQAIEETEDDKKQIDLIGGRFGDWRRAVANWEYYHPAHEDYQAKGNCNRVIFRCLNVGTRTRVLTQDEVDLAFRRADQGENTILAFADHDWRNMIPDIEEVYEMILKASKKYKDVKWINAGAYEAAKSILGVNMQKIQLKTQIVTEGNYKKLLVESNIDTFGPQPFLAIKTKSKRYIMENFDFQVPKRSWTYTFDEHSIPIEDVELIGVATNSSKGTGHLTILDQAGNTKISKDW